MSSALVETDINEIPNIVARVRDGFESHNGWSAEQHRRYRLHQLQQLKKMLEENEKRICDALWMDLHKNHMEAMLMGYNLVYTDLMLFLRDLDDWTKPRPVEKDLLNKLNTIYLQPEPYGTVLIISPWNFPFHLAMQPFIGAMAAGNAVVLKPSEIAVASSNLLAELIPKYLDSDFYTIITGGVEVSQTVLKERFDYIFYTGSTAVGRIVMRAAAENLTPVTLELGGKSPVIIADDANIDVAARRIIWGKFLNAGQTCIAPDYILCSPGKRERLVEMMRKTVVEFYGSEDPSQCKDYCKIISTRHYHRLCKLMDSTRGRNVLSGSRDEGDCFIAPAVYVDVSSDDPLMQEEIFGPVLPIITVDSIEEAIKFINSREKPLAFYIFTENKKTVQMVSNRTSSGALVHNDTIIYGGVKTLPFGGVGHSGMGVHHGRHCFETFTHLKPVYSTGTGLEAINKIRYPPFNATKLSRMKWLMTPSSHRSRFGRSLFTLVLAVGAVAVFYKVFGIPWLYN